MKWAVSLLRRAGTTVSAIARRLRVNWHTWCNAVRKHAETSIDIKKRASGVKAIEVDEHIWRPGRISSPDKAVTVMADLSRGPDLRLCARLLDAVQDRSGTGCADWLKEQGFEVTVSVECAALDPFAVTRHVYRQVRSIRTATSPAAHRKTAEKVLESLHT